MVPSPLERARTICEALGCNICAAAAVVSGSGSAHADLAHVCMV